jgi:uncharacterized membrane protein YkvA (DUF1232 family)
MSSGWLVWAALIVVVIYGSVVVGFWITGRRQDAAAFARFVPDCVLLFARLTRDPRLPRRHRVLLLGVTAYLAMPIDLIPDFIPVAGQLDDAIVVGLALRVVIRRAGHGLLAEHWPGPERSLGVIEHLAGATR